MTPSEKEKAAECSRAATDSATSSAELAAEKWADEHSSTRDEDDDGNEIICNISYEVEEAFLAGWNERDREKRIIANALVDDPLDVLFITEEHGLCLNELREAKRALDKLRYDISKLAEGYRQFAKESCLMGEVARDLEIFYLPVEPKRDKHPQEKVKGGAGFQAMFDREMKGGSR